MVELRCAWCQDEMGTKKLSTTLKETAKKTANALMSKVPPMARNGTTHGICESCRVGTQELARLAATACFQIGPLGLRGDRGNDDDQASD